MYGVIDVIGVIDVMSVMDVEEVIEWSNNRSSSGWIIAVEVVVE